MTTAHVARPGRSVPHGREHVGEHTGADITGPQTLPASHLDNTFRAQERSVLMPYEDCIRFLENAESILGRHTSTRPDGAGGRTAIKKNGRYVVEHHQSALPVLGRIPGSVLRQIR